MGVLSDLMNRAAFLAIALSAILAPTSPLMAEEWETQWAPTPFGQMAYWDVGEGDQTIIFVHGLPTAKHLWRDVIPTLPEGYRAIALDLNNFGESDPLRRPMDHKERAQGIEALRAHLDVDSFVLVSHDLGSSVAVDYMDLYGEHVDAIAMMSSPVYPDFDEPTVVDIVRRPILGRILTNTMPGILYGTTLRLGVENNGAVTRDLIRGFRRYYRGPRGKETLRRNLWWGTPEVAFADYPQIMADYDVPCLIVQGLEDPWIPVEHARRMEADIPGAELVLIDGGGHFIPLGNPEAVGAALGGFLEGLGS